MSNERRFHHFSLLVDIFTESDSVDPIDVFSKLRVVGEAPRTPQNDRRAAVMDDSGEYIGAVELLAKETLSAETFARVAAGSGVEPNVFGIDDNGREIND